MARTPSNMLPLGTKAPDFQLPDPSSGNMISISELRSDVGLVVMFICNHCPFVIHVQDEIVRIAKDYQTKGISFVAINSNDVENYPQDSPENMKLMAEEKGYSFPYLFDETQEVARAYEAACTPDFFVFNTDLELYYRGQMDGSRPGNEVPVTGEDLRRSLDLLLEVKPAPELQLPSIGCNIKWR